MSTEQQPAPAATSRVETQVGGDGSVSVEPVRGKKGEATTSNDTAVSVTVGDEHEQAAAQALQEIEDGKVTEGEHHEDEPSGEGDPETPPEAAATEPLPEFDAEKPEVVEEYQKRFFNADNQLDQVALTTEFWENRAKDPNAYLTEGTTKFLSHQLGVTPEFIQTVCDGLVLKGQDSETKLFERVGGKEAYSGAVAWAREGGYTKEQQDAYNALAKKGGPEFQDAMELLVSRHAKATGKAVQPSVPGKPQRRAASPQRPVVPSSPAAKTVQPFKDQAEYKAARSAAKSEAEVREVRQRLAASPWT